MILLVGGAGYIGSHVNKLLAAQGYQTVVFDNLSRGHRDFVKWGEFFYGDLANVEDIRNCFTRYPIDAVMHFSAFAYVGESVCCPKEYYRNNVANTLSLLQVMLEFQVKHLIFSSSCSIYGIPECLPVDENESPKPINPYGRSKWFVEQILSDYDRAYGVKSICLRYFNAAGADPNLEVGERHFPETHLIPLGIQAAMMGSKFQLFGTDYPTKDGTCIRDFIHVQDIAEAHVLALEYLQKYGRTAAYNLGLEKGFSVLETIRTIEEVCGRNVEVQIEPKRPGDPPVLISSSQRARCELGWKPKFNELRDIVETAWKWHLRECQSGTYRSVS